MMFSRRNIAALIIVPVSVFIAKSFFTNQLQQIVEGFFDPRFRPVAELFRRQIESGLEPGGSYAVFLNGELVVDLWGGYADVEFEVPWRNDTVANVASVTKAAAIISLARLVDQGYLDYDKLVSDYWPEFAQNGKDNVTVKMLLSHQAGVSEIDPPIRAERLKKSRIELEDIWAAQKPVWPPGTSHGYHSVVYGLYAGALLRRVDPKRREVGEYFKEEIAQPFDIDFHIGLPKALQYRLAREYPPNIITRFFETIIVPKYRKAFLSSLFNGNFKRSMECLKNADKIARDPEFIVVPFASGNGFGTARGIAKMFSILANGGRHNSMQLLSNNMINMLKTPIVRGLDVLLESEQAYSVGMWIMENAEGDEVFGHPGFGGNIAYADTKNKLSVAYATNHQSLFALGQDPRFNELEKVTYQCLRKMQGL